MKSKFRFLGIVLIILTGITLIACPKEPAEITITVSPQETRLNVAERGKTIVFEASIKEGERIISQDVIWDFNSWSWDDDSVDFDRSKGILSVRQGASFFARIIAVWKIDQRLIGEATVVTSDLIY